MEYINFAVQALFLLLVLSTALYLFGYVVALLQMPFSGFLPQTLLTGIIDTSISVLWIVAQLYFICATMVAAVLSSELNSFVLIIISLIFILYLIIHANPSRKSSVETIMEECYSNLLLSSSNLFAIKIYALLPMFFLLYFFPNLIWNAPIILIAEICRFLYKLPILDIIIYLLMSGIILHMIFTLGCMIYSAIVYIVAKNR